MGKHPVGCFYRLAGVYIVFLKGSFMPQASSGKQKRVEQHLEALLRAAIGHFRSRLVALVSG
jgi:hypothetical protein